MMTASLKDWAETRIYKRIVEGAGSNLPCFNESRCTLDSCMGRIQAVLQQGGTAATDFTLHDAQHGFRVAERMVEIIPAEVFEKLSAYELALLLLSAYLHDIGMTPERDRVTGHYRYLLTADAGDMDETEVDNFRQWLDVHGDGLSPPLIRGIPTGKTLGEAEWLVAHYCRERHNDWSGVWIETNLANEPNPFPSSDGPLIRRGGYVMEPITRSSPCPFSHLNFVRPHTMRTCSRIWMISSPRIEGTHGSRRATGKGSATTRRIAGCAGLIRLRVSFPTAWVLIASPSRGSASRAALACTFLSLKKKTGR